MTQPRPSTTATGDGDRPPALALARHHDAAISVLHALALRITGAAGEAGDVVEQTLLEARTDSAALPAWRLATLARRCRDLALVRSGKRPIGSVRRRPSLRPRADARAGGAEPDLGAARAAAADTMARLSEADRRVLEMVYFEGYQVADVAVCARCPRREVLVRLRRAIAAFAGPGPARDRISLSAPPAEPAPTLRARLLAAVARGA